jgi:hypothetical protein
MTLHLSQIGFTDARTFMFFPFKQQLSPFDRILPVEGAR